MLTVSDFESLITYFVRPRLYRACPRNVLQQTLTEVSAVGVNAVQLTASAVIRPPARGLPRAARRHQTLACGPILCR